MMVQRHWAMEQVKLPRESRAHQTNQLRFQPWSDLPTMMGYFLPVVPVLPRTADYTLLVVPALPSTGDYSVPLAVFDPPRMADYSVLQVALDPPRMADYTLWAVPVLPLMGDYSIPLVMPVLPRTADYSCSGYLVAAMVVRQAFHIQGTALFPVLMVFYNFDSAAL
jgi:hypothetical protein